MINRWICVAENDEDINELYIELINDWYPKFRKFSTTSANQMIEFIEGQHNDIATIVTDYRFDTDKYGRDIIECAMKYEIPTLLISGKERDIEMNANSVKLIKPVDGNALELALRFCMKKERFYMFDKNANVDENYGRGLKH